MEATLKIKKFRVKKNDLENFRFDVKICIYIYMISIKYQIFTSFLK